MNWDSFSDVQRAVTAWASRQFPKRTSAGVFLKLYQEVGELIADPSSPHEAADVFILLLDYCSMNHINIAKAIAEKMEINEARRWVFDEVTGLAQHIEERPMSTSIPPLPTGEQDNDPENPALPRRVDPLNPTPTPHNEGPEITNLPRPAACPTCGHSWTQHDNPHHCEAPGCDCIECPPLGPDGAL